MHELPDLSTLTSDQKDELIRQLFPLLAEVRRLSALVAELEGRLSKNSHNSSKPPSSDGLAKKTQSLRQPSGKKPGGQIGHPGQTLKRSLEPDEIIHSPLPQRCTCGASLSESDARIAERRQVFDIPAAHYEVVEHRTLQLRCACGLEHVSAFPADVTEAVQYGPNVRALGVHLTQGQLLPYGRAAQLIADQFHLEVSPATLLAWVDEASDLLQPVVEQIAQTLIQAPVAHADESGLRVAGKLHWLHTVVTDTHTWYGVHARRGMQAIEAQGILPKRTAVLVHDCWAPYWQLDCIHALCNAHLTLPHLPPGDHRTSLEQAHDRPAAGRERDLQGRTPAGPKDADSGTNQADSGGLPRDFARRRSGSSRSHPNRQSARAGQTGTCFNLLRRLREYADKVLLFASDLSVTFTNNLGERAIRMPKVKQKISGCFRTVDGANNFAIIRSYLDTLHKQGHNLLDALRLAFQGQPPQPATG